MDQEALSPRNADALRRIDKDLAVEPELLRNLVHRGLAEQRLFGRVCP